MAFVFYDLETTGRSRHFDQILQFAAIKTDLDFQEIDRFEASCRLQPHILPAPRALRVNGLRISTITHPSRISYYEMVSAIHTKLASWSPAMFLGYNSLKFDDEFMRNAFYQCLYPPYIMNTRPNIRGDVLRLVRALSITQPNRLNVPIEGGRLSFALSQLAIANGFPAFNAHEAMADVKATAYLCAYVARQDEALWSQFQRCAQKASAQAFLEDQDAVFLCDASARRRACIATLVGRNSDQKSAHIYYCVNLSANMAELRECSESDLESRFREDNDIIHRVKVNACPVIYELADVPAHLTGGISEDDWRARGRLIKDDLQFMERIRSACERTERVYPTPIHVEEQLYDGGFWPDSDKALLQQFHRQSWEYRPATAQRLTDRRLQQLSRRLIYVERPNVLTDREREAMRKKMQNRFFGIGIESSPLTTIAQALEEIDRELTDADPSTAALLHEYRAFLSKIPSGEASAAADS